MGVLSCSRLGCGNIMCDRLSHDYGYICWECFDELCALGTDTNIESFMGTQKVVDEKAPFINPYDYFDEIFPDKREEDG